RPIVTMADEAPPAADRQWLASSDKSADVDAARSALEQQVKTIAHLPVKAVRAVASLAGLAQENVPGTWEIRPADTKGMVHLRIVEVNSSSVTNVPIEQLEGLSGGQLTGAGGQVQFK